MTTVTDADRARIQDRYAVPPSRRKLYLTLVTVLSLALAGWLVWAGGTSSTPDVTADVYGFQETGEHEIVADLRVQRRDPAKPVICVLEATAENFVRVGEYEATIPGGTEKITRTKIPVKTVNRAVSVEVASCRLA
ncbi:DUF4307 domain-containing protein [Luteococcus sp. Sow4_B9]|uniref:DUF4307 domain-containing protein n=1 Tax=Luteococcus sp. Sow4_B9 TaxID=3438792 RepID=UPI003F977571